MRKIVCSINITPDGFCNHQDVIADRELHQFINKLTRNADTVILGRSTYDLFAEFWPAAANDKSLPKEMQEFGQLISNIHKIVISKKEKLKSHWQNSTILRSVTKQKIIALKQKKGKNILILGSPSIVDILTKLELIDEYYFSIQPIISGKGKRLFEKIHLKKSQNFKLASSFLYKSGVITLFFKRK
jgi:dihydrofolate reductase